MPYPPPSLLEILTRRRKNGARHGKCKGDQNRDVVRTFISRVLTKHGAIAGHRRLASNSAAAVPATITQGARSGWRSHRCPPPPAPAQHRDQQQQQQQQRAPSGFRARLAARPSRTRAPDCRRPRLGHPGRSGEVHQEEGEGRRVRGEEAVARKGGFGDEERDGWRLGGGGGRMGRVFWGGGARRGNTAAVRMRMRIGGGGAGGVFVDDPFELAEVCRSHLALFGFALGKDAQSSPVHRAPVPGLCGDVERI
ncbi:hypothetical protein BJV78DRAFT_397160 [Lactifluus subvellereus]|nr:hypothetical protein BJV78DRAFT_397160 [Lactifluus subvellereus]